MSETALSTTVQEVIHDLFKRLEVKHDQVFVSHALAYITASMSGLSESELEDVLSLDDVVLEDVFQYHVPLVRRIPQVLIIRVLHDISQYIVTREADNTRVLCWYHRHFTETARERFVSALEVSTHKHLADYFLGKWHATEKPFTYNSYQMQKLGLSSPEGKADRLVPPQPIILRDGDSQERAKFNLRKLNNLPWHLLHAEDIVTMKNTCLFNLDFLQAKLQACGVQSVLSDLQETQERYPDESLMTYLRSALSEAGASLTRHPTTLSVELAGRLLHLAKPNEDIALLVEQCYLQATLLPVTTTYPTPGGALTQSLEHRNLPITDKNLFVVNRGRHLLALSKTNELIVWDRASGDVEREVCLWEGHDDNTKFNILKQSTDRELLVAADAFQRSGNSVAVYNVKTDEIIFAGKLEKTYKSVGFIDNFSICATNKHIVINVKDKEGDVFDMEGHHLHKFAAPASSIYITPSGQTVALLLSDKPELAFFSLERLAHWSETVLLPEHIDDDLVAKGKHLPKIYIVCQTTRKLETITLNEESDSTGRETEHLEKYMPSATQIKSVRLSDDERSLLISSPDQVLMWDLVQANVHRTFVIPAEAIPEHKVQTLNSAIDPSCKTLAVALEDKLIVFK